ncbi:MAG: hypothetical protein HOP10_13165 [Chitinophagaceae bacterium]|jgi:hypothetical protein|nr:hypothetical protein [Chitinophagaceae bacterium]
MIDADKLEELNSRFKKDIAATYFISKYYFSVNTNKLRADIGLLPEQEIDLVLQRKIQAQNFTSLFHEYIHYIHEISTVIGNIGLSLDLILKSIFSNYFSSHLDNCEYNGFDFSNRELLDKYSKIYATKEVINGGGILEGFLIDINLFLLKRQDVYLLDGNNLISIKIIVPMVNSKLFINGTYKAVQLPFGKFYIYEGMAYELDRIVHKQVNELSDIKDELRSTEYTVLRSLAKFIYPDIDTECYLVAASLSLSYLDSGSVFISFIEKIKAAIEGGITKQEILVILKTETGAILISKLNDFNEAQDEIMEIFKKRKQLYKAFSTITEEAKKGYLLRCKYPAFEIDFVISGDYIKLPDLVPVCDYMYIFKDTQEYMRDFLGTASYTDEQSQALKVLIAYDHYQKAHWIKSTKEIEKIEKSKCPFFSCCNLAYRKNNESICAEKPWRTFEISYNTDKKYCWYGQAVGEFKGPNEL